MPVCAFKHCVHNNRNTNHSEGISFFRFPRNPFRCAQWASIVAKERGEQIYRPGKSSTICSVHFDESDITGNTQRRRLLKTAVPKFQETSSLKSINDGSSIKSHDTKSAVTLHVGECKKSVTDGCSMKSHDTRSANLPIIAKVFIFLEREYEYMKTLNGDNCDLSPLADVLKRTAEATGFGEDDVIMVMEKEGLADHLPNRARRKRRKDCDYLYKLCGSKDDKVLEIDNLNVTVTGNAGYGHEALSSAPTYVFLASDTEQTHVKVEPEDNEDVTSHNVLHHIPPLESNSAPTDVFLISDTEQTQVKVEPEDNEDVTPHNVLHNIPLLGSNDEYFNEDEDDKMDIEQYTFTGARPNVPPNPTAAVSEHADIKIEPADDH